MRFAKVKLDNGREVFAGRLVDRNLEEQHIGTLETGTPAFRPVETAGDGPFDAELFSRMGPDYEVKPEKVIERFRLEPVPGAADILADRIAKKAGKARMQLTGTPSLGQHREFAWLTADAAKAIKLAEEEERLLGDEDREKFPFLSADPDVTDILDEAHRVMGLADSIRKGFAAIRRNRLALIKGVDALLAKGMTADAVKKAADLVDRSELTAP